VLLNPWEINRRKLPGPCNILSNQYVCTVQCTVYSTAVFYVQICLKSLSLLCLLIYIHLYILCCEPAFFHVGESFIYVHVDLSFSVLESLSSMFMWTCVFPCQRVFRLCSDGPAFSMSESLSSMFMWTCVFPCQRVFRLCSHGPAFSMSESLSSMFTWTCVFHVREFLVDVLVDLRFSVPLPHSPLDLQLVLSGKLIGNWKRIWRKAIYEIVRGPFLLSVVSNSISIVL
jgi:hypothetical protein